MIRKTLLLGLLALAGLGAAAPALLGLYLEREFAQRAAELDERPGIRVVEQAFERGWFESQARLRLGPDAALCGAPPCPGLELDTTIYHGPLALGAPPRPIGAGEAGDEAPPTGLAPALGVAVTRIDWAALWPRLVFDPPLAPLAVHTRVGFDGRATSALRIAGTDVTLSREQPLARIELAPVLARLSLGLAGGGYSGQLDSPGFKIVGEQGGQFGWQGLELWAEGPTQASAEAGPAAVDDAGAGLTARSLRLGDGLGGSALLQSLSLNWQALPAPGEGLNGRFEARLSEALINNRAYGPLTLGGELAHLRPLAWRELFIRLSNLRDTDTGRFDAAERAALYEQTLPAVLSGGSRIAIERLSFSTPRGEVSARLLIEAPEQLREVRLLADVISQLQIDFEIRMPSELARDIAVQVMLASGRSPYAIEKADVDTAMAELTEQGLIEPVARGAGYRLRLTVDNGLLQLNGRNQIGWQSVVDQFEAARERL